MSDIPQGFRLTLESWENDGDHRKDVNFDGLAGEDVDFLIEMASLLKSVNNSGGRGFGGSARHYKLAKRGNGHMLYDLSQAMSLVVRSHYGKVNPDLLSLFVLDAPDLDDYEDDEKTRDALNEQVLEAVERLVGYPGEDYSDEHYIRVFDGFEVHHFTAVAPDVTRFFPSTK